MPSKQQLHQAARHLVVAQALLRGYPAELVGPSTRAKVNDKVVHVFSRTPNGAWQPTQTPPIVEDADAAVFVDLDPAGPQFYILDADRAREGIESRYDAFLEKHGGTRPRTPGSSHRAVSLEHVVHGHNQWDLLA